MSPVSPMIPLPKCKFGVRYCKLGVLIGVGLGALEFFDSRALGFSVTFHGEPMFWVPLIWHVLTWGVIFYFLARFLEQKQVAQEGAAIIQAQFAKLAASQDQLVRSAKLAALGELSASMAHEIRNPLGIIRSSAQLIREGFPDGDENVQACDFITDEIDRLNELITSLLRFARAKEPALQSCDANAILRRSAQFLGGELRKRQIELECRLAPELPAATMDEDQIYQVILEMMLNASRAMSDGGRIVARTAPTVRGGQRGIEISISDSGAGIPAHDVDRIWDPFFTTRAEGTGLGLSVVKQIVERHHGEVSVESSPGHGATFFIRLPLELPAPLAGRDPGEIHATRGQHASDAGRSAGELVEELGSEAR